MGGDTDDASVVEAETAEDASAAEAEDEEEAEEPSEEEEPAEEEVTEEQPQEGADAAEEAPEEAEEAEEEVEDEGDASVSAQSTVASGTCGTNLTWTLDDAGTLTISGTGAMTSYTSETPPWYDYTGKILKIVIGDSVTSIGNDAFSDCWCAESVDFGSGVTSIGDFAFSACASLTSIDLPESMETIGNYAFYECWSLNSADLGCTAVIGDYAFAYCWDLTNVVWYSVTSIGAYAFYCTGLNGSFTIGKSITHIGEYALGYDEWGKYEDFTIYGYSGTAGETYANENGFTFVDLGGPAAPTLSSVSNTTSGVKITWKKVSGVTGYRVYRKAAGDSSWTIVKSSTTSTSYTDTTAKSGTTYYYTVRAYTKVNGTNYWGSYNTTGLKIIFLSQPTLSSVTNLTSGIKVKWASVSGAAGYRIYRKAGSETSWTKVKTLSSSSTSWVDKDVINGTKYTYIVKAYAKSSGTTYWSVKSASKKTYRVYYTSITSLSNSASKKLTVKWAKNSKATGYQIQYSTSSSFSSYKTVTVTSYKTVSKTISGLTKGKKYYVRVRVYKTVSGTKYYSAWSEVQRKTISK